MATEDKSDVECKAIKANSGLGLSAAVSVHVCVHGRCLRLEGGMGTERLWRGWGVVERYVTVSCPQPSRSWSFGNTAKQ